MSLKERIRNAESIQEIEKILAEGTKYQFAAPSTQRKWVRAAHKRAKELEK
jgi:hypothetical protein